MNLLVKTEDLQKRLSKLSAARGDFGESKALDDFRVQNLSPRNVRLQKIAATQTLLLTRQITYEKALAGASQLASKVANLRKRFTQKPTRAVLVAADGWTAIQPGLDTYIGAAEKSARIAWSTYCAEHAPADEPISLRSDPTICLHAENIPILREYDSEFQWLARASSNVPLASSSVDEYLEHAARAKALLQKLNRTAPPPDAKPPPAIEEFLKAVQQGPVPLDNVPDEVIDWLDKRGRRGQFEIRLKV